MNFAFASGLYALVADEFDARERRDMTVRLQDVLESLGYARAATMYESELALLGSLIYGLLAACSQVEAFRTPGQDYCGLLPVNSIDSDDKSSYSLLDRSDFAKLIMLLSISDYFSTPRHQSITSRLFFRYFPKCLTSLGNTSLGSMTGGFFYLFNELHRVILLMDGRFVTPIHRLLQIRSASVAPHKTGQTLLPDRKVLVIAWLLIFRFGVQSLPTLFKCLQWIQRRLWNSHRFDCSESITKKTNQAAKPNYFKTNRKCILCMDFIATDCTACIPCGHIFCYACITKWLSTQPKCPICRTHQLPQQVRMLYNFSG